MKEYLNILFSGKSLNRTEAEQAMNSIIEGNALPEQVSAFLGALRVKGETVEEIVGFAKSIRANAVNIQTKHRYLTDVCGTGGDGTNTFNISTAAAFVIAGTGIPVGKHGNIAVSSKCGSADVLKALGVKIDFTPEKITGIINEIGIGFLFAPLFHPAMKNVAPIRKAIGLRTVFNMLGPLCNPAGVKRQIIGVYDKNLIGLIAAALIELECEEAMVLSSDDGMDEISLSAKTEIAHVKDGKVLRFTVSPEDFGCSPSSIENLKGGDAVENAVTIENILKGEKGPKRDIVLMNAAAAIKVSGIINDLKTGVQVAEEAINSGKAFNKLEQLRYYQ